MLNISDTHTLLHQSFLFFFYLYGSHRYLHSFPTRRSSDVLMISKPVSGSKSISITMVNATSPRRLNWTIDASTQYHDSKKAAVRKHCRLLLVIVKTQKFGLRFSTKALMPSFCSSPAKQKANRAVSRAKALSSSCSMPS